MAALSASARSGARAAMSQSDRTKRCRARQRAGIVVLSVPVNHYEFADVLIAGEWLTEAEALDKANLATAASRIVDEWTKEKRAK
jgi:hypothetical protein